MNRSGKEKKACDQYGLSRHIQTEKTCKTARQEYHDKFASFLDVLRYLMQNESQIVSFPLIKTSDKYNIQHRKPLEMAQTYQNHLGPVSNHQFNLPQGCVLSQLAYFAFNSFLNSHCFQKTRLYRTGQRQGKGKWTKQQQTKYIYYLWSNIDEFRSKLSRKSRKVFVKMSNVIGSRTADQCRSHHQKVLNEYRSIENIITYYSRNIFKGKNSGISMTAEKEERQTSQVLGQMKEKGYRWSYRDGNRLRLEIVEEGIFSVCYE